MNESYQASTSCQQLAKEVDHTRSDAAELEQRLCVFEEAQLAVLRDKFAAARQSFREF